MAEQEGPTETGAVYVNADAAGAAFLARLLDDEDTGHRVWLEAGPYTMLMLIAAVRLGLSHPSMPAGIRTVLEAYANQWSEAYKGTPVQLLADNGYMPHLMATPGWLN